MGLILIFKNSLNSKNIEYNYLQSVFLKLEQNWISNTQTQINWLFHIKTGFGEDIDIFNITNLNGMAN